MSIKERRTIPWHHMQIPVSNSHSMDGQKSSAARLLEKKTPWISIFTTSWMMLFVGLQMSVYFTSTWQYIKSIHPQPKMELFGWVLASTSLGCAIANPIYGYWNQKTLSTKKPLTVGFMLAAVGNLLYALLPLFPDWSLSIAFVFSRFLEGFGAGTLGILRNFLGTASTSKDRVRAVSLGTSGLTAGFSLGPVLQICFLPLGSTGYVYGPFLFNTYTSVGYFMFLASCFGILLTNFVLVEDYAGIITDEEKKADPFTIIPRFDRVAVVVLFIYWWMFCAIGSTEGLASPITMAMYNWSSEEAVLYNGGIQMVSCLTSTLVYVLFGATRVGKWNRRWHLMTGLLLFLSFHLLHLPWPFYEGPLDRAPAENGTGDAGGCSLDYEWCDYTPRIPKYLYIFWASVIMGFSFPLVAAPCNTMLTEILGPRKQGLVQGLYAFTGSMSSFLFPIISSAVFEATGYVYIMAWHVTMLLVSLLLLLFFRKRLVPLSMTPPLGLATKYKSGTFYRL